MYGKTIELFLLNGNADSLITAELSNWNGKAIKIPRTEVESCEREDIKGIGVYFLISQEEDGTNSVYIGEAENIKDRLIQHLRDFKSGKEEYYWNTALLFLGRDLNKALIRYLENRFVEIAKECQRYKILTKNTFKNTIIKESHVASMEEFIDNVKILANTLGYKVLLPTPKPNEKTEYLYCKGKDSNAKGFISQGGFTVVKNSIIASTITESMKKHSYFNLRNSLLSEGIINNNQFERDYEFKSPSAASSVVLGKSSNGNTDWKTSKGKMLRDI
ncbi:GIY-YIG nuclease family protein [Mesomycoplasma molare]|uniref:GIY-YIG nuclease family protein n=1 Tax=Mesomycoplasma molare TaxID=171288 RepID=A0ABY5TUC2_9BACT|nr:GIY-YIG nuclease family protein [Mesomycoplasma molare]UWD33914.1 GIY-YIG nuclease family protein [Mesomycoplasma molare]